LTPLLFRSRGACRKKTESIKHCLRLRFLETGAVSEKCVTVPFYFTAETRFGYRIKTPDDPDGVFCSVITAGAASRQQTRPLFPFPSEAQRIICQTRAHSFTYEK